MNAALPAITAASTPTAASAAISTVTVIAALVALALHRTALPVLSLRVEILRGITSGGAILIEVLLIVLSSRLAVWVLLLIVRLVLLRLLCVDVAPATTAVRLLPAGARVLVDVSVMAGVHVTT